MKNYFDYQTVYNHLKKLNNNLEDRGEKFIYHPYEGFIRGNMFSDLYKPYKITNPYKIEPVNEQASMLTKIDALEFACIDINIYLDIYPNDKNTIELYNRYKNEKIQLTNEYEKKFGPLTLDSNSLENTPWAWDNMPWPWNR